MKDYSKEHELMRRKIWMGAWVRVASAVGCNESSIATSWADNALKEFDKRFSQFEEIAND